MAQTTRAAEIIRLIGNTPLLRIRMFEREFPRVEVYAKAEWFNPGGSVKDRAALSMIERPAESVSHRRGLGQAA